MKKIKNNNPFDSLILDEKEKSLEEAFERGEFEESSNIEDTRKMLQEAASRYLELRNSKPVTLRINQLDLIKIKAKANMNNIPYQTLLGALLHDFAEGETKLSI
jgi:predicted DNA binding CopG/RHH family protein